ETRASLRAAPFGVRYAGQTLFSAPSVEATAGSKGKEPLGGRIRAPSGNLQKLPFEDLAADWIWDKGALQLEPALRAFGGSLRGRIESDFSHPRSESRVRLEIRRMQAKPLVETLTPMRNVLSGILTADMSLSTHGLDWDALSKTGRGDGKLSIEDAELKTVE